jgi:hypothetical protein
VDLGQLVVRVRRIRLGRLAEQQKRPDHLALGLPEQPAEQVPHGEVRLQGKRLVDRLLGVFDLPLGEQDVRVVPPDRRLGAVRPGQRLHRLDRPLVLPLLLLVEGQLDLPEVWGAAPLELLAAAARAGVIWVRGHNRPPWAE